jgi:hypothetical protein
VTTPERPLKTGDYVEAPGRRVGVVLRVQDHLIPPLAIVTMDDTEKDLNFPVSELRRLHIKRPPIEDMPSDRPACDHCRRPLAPEIATERDAKFRPIRRVFNGWRCWGRKPERGRFCSPGCAVRFAHAAFAAGYRITKGSK